MSDIELVIKIPKDSYEATCNGCMLPPDVENVVNAIKNGTPLPEHHGLIDRLELSDHIKNRLIQTAMNNMETILPYSQVCTDIDDNRIDTWIDEVKTIIEGSESE
jgi:hypothetical protein